MSEHFKGAFAVKNSRKLLAGSLLISCLFLSGLSVTGQSAKPAPGKNSGGAAGSAKAGGGTSKKPASAGMTKAGLQASLDRGKQVYLEQCLACHQADAGGVQGMNPPLIGTKWILGDKTTLVQVVLKGMSGEVDINGDTYHNVMAPHSELTDRQIADVLTYVRNNFGNKAKPVTEAEVKAIRAKTK